MTVVSWREAFFSAAMISGVLAAGLGAACSFLAATATGASFLAAAGVAMVEH